MKSKIDVLIPHGYKPKKKEIDAAWIFGTLRTMKKLHSITLIVSKKRILVFNKEP